MDRHVIRQRLAELGLEQRDLARAAAVPNLTFQKVADAGKSSPAPQRTDMYDKLDTVCSSRRGELA